MSSYVNVFSGGLLAPSNLFLNKITLNSNITLDIMPYFGANPNPIILASINEITATRNGFTITLPNATTLSNGFNFSINNKSVYSFTLLANDGTLVTNVPGLAFYNFYLSTNTTSAGSWVLQLPGAGSTSVTSVGISTSGTSGNIITSGSPITTAGTISLTFGADLAGLTTLGNNVGIAVRTAANGSWSTTSFLGAANQISIANPNGVSGAPTFSLAAAIQNIASISLNAGGNLEIGVIPNVIEATNANGSVSLVAQGTGIINLLGGAGLSPNAIGVSIGSSLLISGSSALYLGDSVNLGNSVLLNAHNVTSTYTITLPGAPGVGSQVMAIGSVVGSDLEMTWVSAPTFSGTSVVNTIPIYTNTGGALGDSSVTITASNVLGSISQLNVGNISLISSTNTIESAMGNLFVTAPGGSFIGNKAPTYMLSSQPLYFSTTSVGTDHYLGFVPPAVITANTLWTLPAQDGTANQFIQTNGAGVLSFAGGNAGTVTSITEGANIVCTPNPIVSTGTIATTLTPSFTNLSTAPANSSATALSLGSAFQNTLGYDAMVVVVINITVNTSGTVSVGVGSTNAPAQETFATGVTTTGFLTIPVYLPKNYYALISVSSITATIVGQIAFPV